MNDKVDDIHVSDNGAYNVANTRGAHISQSFTKMGIV